MFFKKRDFEFFLRFFFLCTLFIIPSVWVILGKNRSVGAKFTRLTNYVSLVGERKKFVTFNSN